MSNIYQTPGSDLSADNEHAVTARQLYKEQSVVPVIFGECFWGHFCFVVDYICGDKEPRTYVDCFYAGDFVAAVR